MRYPQITRKTTARYTLAALINEARVMHRAPLSPSVLIVESRMSQRRTPYPGLLRMDTFDLSRIPQTAFFWTLTMSLHIFGGIAMTLCPSLCAHLLHMDVAAIVEVQTIVW